MEFHFLALWTIPEAFSEPEKELRQTLSRILHFAASLDSNLT
jgi:hypothetical protein